MQKNKKVIQLLTSQRNFLVRFKNYLSVLIIIIFSTRDHEKDQVKMWK